jgi:FKBP-type peptidyl-prolyl cis-trans isomerase (trigger factor)
MLFDSDMPIECVGGTNNMSKSTSAKIEDARKFLEKNAKANLNLKLAQSAVADSEKTTMELAQLKAKIHELTEARDKAIYTLDQAMARVKLEKKLKTKESKLQKRLADLSSAPDGAK